jgi:pseudaminic acid cytidylyltransferase
MNICLIPARKGSKRIKNKNIKNFNGKPIIYYSIKAALNSKLFDKIVVSTDSEKIKKIAIKFGAEVPFIRPKNISDDFAIDFDVINHYLQFCKKQKISINNLCYLYPVNPLIKISTLKRCNKLLDSFNCQSVITVRKYAFPIEMALIKNSNGYIKLKNTKFKKKRSQDFNSSYEDAGQCYWYKVPLIKKFINLRTIPFELDKFEYLDVDSKKDFNNLKKIFNSKLHINR